MVDLASYATYVQTHQFQINMGFNVFIILILIVAMFGGGIGGVGTWTLLILALLAQGGQLALNFMFAYKPTYMSDMASRYSQPM